MIFDSPTLTSTERRISDEGLRQIPSGLLPSGTVLVSSRAPIGYTAIADVEVAINQGIAAMVCDGPVPNYYAYFWSKENLDTIISHANGSTFLEISKGNFRKIEALLPDSRILRAFPALVASMFQQIANATRQSRTLAAIRDTLLPKLISGEIRAHDSGTSAGAHG
jgi:type I restriction enzyme S subunit